MSVVNVYAPYRRSADELERTFVARQAMLDELLRFLGSQWRRRTHQHVLLVGPRGIGKSHMLAMVKMRLGQDPQDLGQWLPVVFAQEGYGILRLGNWIDAWVSGAIQAARAQDLDVEDLEAVAAEKAGASDAESIERKLATLARWARTRKRKYLLLAENLDRLFGKRLFQHRPSQKRLREILQHDPNTLLLGTSPTRFKQLTSGAEPMYELFRIHPMEEFSRHEMNEMLRLRAEYDRESPILADPAEQVLQILRGYPGKVRTLYELTGGTPRIIELLYRLLCSSSEASKVEFEFLELLQELTPYYQHRTDNLTDQQEEILMALVQAGFQTTPTRIAEETGIAVNSVTKQLRRLEEHGFVAPQERRGKSTLYALQEKLYRFWLQYHEESTEPLVRLIVEFLAAVYSREELDERYSELKSGLESAGSDRTAPAATGEQRRCLAAARLVAFGDAGERDLQRWTASVKECSSSGERTAEVVRGTRYLALRIPPERLKEAFLDVAESLDNPWEETAMAPLVHALEEIIEGNQEALDRYPPEVRNALGHLYPQLADPDDDPT